MRDKNTYYFSTKEGKKRISQIAQMPLQDRDNKGIYPWHLGNKRYRAIISDKEQKHTVGYFYTFAEAVRAYLVAHKKRFGHLPKCNYRYPSGKLFYKGVK
jgi:hypothetical protein